MHRPTHPVLWSLRLAGRLAITATALWWLGFILLVARSEGAQAYGPAAAIGLPLAVSAVLAWLFPRLGGAAAIVAGVAAAVVFPHPAPRLMMALPLVLGGTLILASALAPARPTPAHS